MSDNIVALFAIFCIFGLPLGGWIIVRGLQYRERMEMIRRGMVPPPSGMGGKDYREAYRIWAQQQQQAYRPGPQPWQAGPVPPPPPGPLPIDPDSPQNVLNKGIKLAFIGLGLLIGLSFIGGNPLSPGFQGGPWLLGGLIPLFVGIAQIIIAVISGAQIPGVQPPGYRPDPYHQSGPFPPPPPPPPNGPPPGATIWERPPGPRYEELSKPPSPPDIK